MVFLVGLTGGIASGKSTVSSVMGKELGCQVIDADKLGHRAYEVGTAAYVQILERFGQELKNEDGSIDRRKLGGIVFGDKSEMKALEGIVWPVIRGYIQEEIEKTKAAEVGSDTNTVIVLEAAIMLEAGWNDMCDQVWVSFVDVDAAKDRLMKRNSLSEEGRYICVCVYITHPSTYPLTPAPIHPLTNPQTHTHQPSHPHRGP